MKLAHYLTTLLLAVLVTGCFEENLTITIKPDGSALVGMEIAMPRQLAEQQVRMTEMQGNGGMGAMGMGMADDGDGATPAAPETPKPLTDAEIITGFKESLLNQWTQQYGAAEPVIESVEIKDDKLRVKASAKFNSLKEMVATTSGFLAEFGFGEMLIDTNATGQLRLTCRAGAGMERYRKQQLKQLRAAGLRGMVKFVMPGKIVSSSLTQTVDNATWFAVDPDKEETFAVLGKLQESSIVIVSETGGLKLTEPIDSKKVARQMMRPQGNEADLPVTDAGPGFQSEAMTVTATTQYLFPDALKEQGENPYAQYANNMNVQAKLYFPKGRTVLGIADVKITKAVDDKGRSLLMDEEGNAMYGGYNQGLNFGPGQSMQSAPLQLMLKLPAADAKTIDEITAEVIATSSGGFKDQSITELKADALKTNDLSSLIPDARLVITKIKGKGPQSSYTVQILGPKTISQLSLKLVTPGTPAGAGNNSMMQNGSTTKNGLTTRTITLMHYSFDPNGGAPIPPNALVVQMPQDVKRERVNVSLKAIDLY